MTFHSNETTSCLNEALLFPLNDHLLIFMQMTMKQSIMTLPHQWFEHATTTYPRPFCPMLKSNRLEIQMMWQN
jgi:hypothetical protein